MAQSAYKCLVKGCQVTIHPGTPSQSTYSFPSTVIDALWCDLYTENNLPSSSSSSASSVSAHTHDNHHLPHTSSVSVPSPSTSTQRCLVVVHGKGKQLFILASNGRSYDTTLPFRVQNLYALRYGCLFQRYNSNKYDNGDNKHRNNPSDKETLPLWYVLYHPLQEATPVGISHPLSNNGSTNGSNDHPYFTDPDEQLIGVIDTSSLSSSTVLIEDASQQYILSYQSTQKYLRIYTVQQSPLSSVSSTVLPVPNHGTDPFSPRNKHHQREHHHPTFETNMMDENSNHDDDYSDDMVTALPPPSVSRSKPVSKLSHHPHQTPQDVIHTPGSVRSVDISGTTRRTVRFRSPVDAEPESDEFIFPTDQPGDILSSNPFLSTARSHSSNVSTNSNVQVDPVVLEERNNQSKYRTLLANDAGDIIKGVQRRVLLRSPSGTIIKSPNGTIHSSSTFGTILPHATINTHGYNTIRSGTGILVSPRSPQVFTLDTFHSHHTIGNNGSDNNMMDAITSVSLDDSFNAPDTVVLTRRKRESTGSANAYSGYENIVSDTTDNGSSEALSSSSLPVHAPSAEWFPSFDGVDAITIQEELDELSVSGYPIDASVVTELSLVTPDILFPEPSTYLSLVDQISVPGPVLRFAMIPHVSVDPSATITESNNRSIFTLWVEFRFHPVQWYTIHPLDYRNQYSNITEDMNNEESSPCIETAVFPFPPSSSPFSFWPITLSSEETEDTSPLTVYEDILLLRSSETSVPELVWYRYNTEILVWSLTTIEPFTDVNVLSSLRIDYAYFDAERNEVMVYLRFNLSTIDDSYPHSVAVSIPHYSLYHSQLRYGFSHLMDYYYTGTELSLYQQHTVQSLYTRYAIVLLRDSFIENVTGFCPPNVPLVRSLQTSSSATLTLTLPDDWPTNRNISTSSIVTIKLQTMNIPYPSFLSLVRSRLIPETLENVCQFQSYGNNMWCLTLHPRLYVPFSFLQSNNSNRTEKEEMDWRSGMYELIGLQLLANIVQNIDDERTERREETFRSPSRSLASSTTPSTPATAIRLLSRLSIYSPSSQGSAVRTTLSGTPTVGTNVSLRSVPLPLEHIRQLASFAGISAVHTPMHPSLPLDPSTIMLKHWNEAIQIALRTLALELSPELLHILNTENFSRFYFSTVPNERYVVVAQTTASVIFGYLKTLHTLVTTLVRENNPSTALHSQQFHHHLFASLGTAIGLGTNTVNFSSFVAKMATLCFADSSTVSTLLTNLFALYFRIPIPLSLTPPPLLYLALGRADLYALSTLIASPFSTFHRKHHHDRLSSARTTTTQSTLLSTAMRNLLLPMPGGVGLGVLTVHGMSGKPATDAGAIGAATGLVINAALGIGDVSNGAPPEQDVDGITAVATTFSALRFSRDTRIRTIGRLLSSCRPHYLRITRPPEASDHDFVVLQQQTLFWHARRICGSLIGRGMLTFGTVLPSYTDPVPIPVITVAARMPPVDVLIKLDISGVTTTVAGITEWPEFFNGTAAGFRLVAPLYNLLANTSSNGTSTPSSTADVTARLVRAWVRSHRYTGVSPDLGAVASAAAAVVAGIGVGTPSAAGIPMSGMASGLIPPNPAHGGLLMALGMSGALNGMSSSDMFEYLAQTHACTTIGLLLGLAAGKRGSMDPIIHKALCLHIPALLPGGYHDLDVPSAVQSASLIGLGLLYQGTGHRAIAEFLAREIGHAPVTERGEEREAYSASAGLALGLVNLGLGAGEDADIWRNGSINHRSVTTSHGTSSSNHPTHSSHTTSATDLLMDDRLLRYMIGGRDPEAEAAHKRTTKKKGTNGNGTNQANSSYGRPNLIYEGDRLNTCVTAPSAVLALGLTYIRTGNRRIAAALNPPDSSIGLDGVRPDVLILRVMARTLVMWSEHNEDDANTVFDYEAWLTDHRYRDTYGNFTQIVYPGPIEARAIWERERRTRVRSWLTQQVPPYVRRIIRRLYANAAANTGPGAAALKLAKLMAMVTDDDETKPTTTNAGGNTADGTTTTTNPTNVSSTVPSSLPPVPRPVTHSVPSSSASVSAPYSSPVDTSDGPLQDIDTDQAKIAYLDCIAGACLGLGLRYAGTGDIIIRDEILTHLTYAMALREAAASTEREPRRESKQETVRIMNYLQANQTHTDATTVAAARALFEELTVLRRYEPSRAIERINELLFIPSMVQPTSDDLLSVYAEPLNAYPFRLSKDGQHVLAAYEKDYDGTGIPSASTRRRTLGTTPSLALACAPDRGAIQMTIASVSIALGLVMAGTGDIASLRAIKELRRRLDAAVSYGDMMATGMALGLLGLGGGKATLSRSTASIAALVAAVFPSWPNGTAANTYFLQAPRALYALAVDTRCLDTFAVSPPHPLTAIRAANQLLSSSSSFEQYLFSNGAVSSTVSQQQPLQDSMRSVYTPIEVTLRPVKQRFDGTNEGTYTASRRLRLITPCLLPELHTIESIQIIGDQYLPYTLDIARNPTHAAILLQGAGTEGVDIHELMHEQAGTGTSVPLATNEGATTNPFTGVDNPFPTSPSLLSTQNMTETVRSYRSTGSSSSTQPTNTAHMFMSPLYAREQSRPKNTATTTTATNAQMAKRRRKESMENEGNNNSSTIHAHYSSSHTVIMEDNGTTNNPTISLSSTTPGMPASSTTTRTDDHDQLSSDNTTNNSSNDGFVDNPYDIHNLSQSSIPNSADISYDLGGIDIGPGAGTSFATTARLMGSTILMNNNKNNNNTDKGNDNSIHRISTSSSTDIMNNGGTVSVTDPVLSLAQATGRRSLRSIVLFVQPQDKPFPLDNGNNRSRKEPKYSTVGMGNENTIPTNKGMHGTVSSSQQIQEDIETYLE